MQIDELKRIEIDAATYAGNAEQLKSSFGEFRRGEMDPRTTALFVRWLRYLLKSGAIRARGPVASKTAAGEWISPCQCEGAGWCPVHRREVSASRAHDCRTRPGFFEALAKPPAAHKPVDLSCVHRGEEKRREVCETCTGHVEVKIFECDKHRECSLVRDVGVTVCAACDPEPPAEKPAPASPPRPLTTSPPLNRPFRRGPDQQRAVVNWHGRPAGCLVNHLRGAPVFLVCGGPSLEQIDLSLLDRRGVLVAAVNQSAATHVRPDFFFCGDPPRKFHAAIWRDPSIAKFCKREDSRVRVTLEWTQVVQEMNVLPGAPPQTARLWKPTKIGEKVRDLPNVWFWERGYGFEARNFLKQPRIAWGKDLGKRATRNVMFPALRLLYWMGCRTVFLLGSDFHMQAGKSYASDEAKSPQAAGTNNNTYRLLDGCFRELRPHFEAADFRVYNCTPGSRLGAFERIDYQTAVDAVTRRVPRVESVRGLYML